MENKPILCQEHKEAAESFLEELTKVKANKLSGTAFMVEIDNFTVIMSIYDRKYAEEVVSKLTKAIIEKFKYNTYLIGCNQIAIISNLNKDSDVAEFVDRLHNLIQFFTGIEPTKPIHLNDIIGSVALEEVEPSKAMDQCLMATRQRAEDDESYYHSYKMVRDASIFYKEQMHMAEVFKNSIKSNKLKFAFQPVINSKNGVIEYYESLLRIVSVDGRITSVGPFIPVAESLGFIDIIDELVLEMAAEELRNNPELKLSFNVSGLGVDNPILMNKIKKLFTVGDLASRAVFEITETALQKDLKKSAYFVATLQDIGAKVALDDFGAGNSSFKQLLTLPVDIIKIDGSFIRDIVSNNDSLVFVKMLLTVCESFKIKTVAEYVENGEIAKKIMDLGVDYMQGNYFSPAINHRPWAVSE